MNLPPYMSVSEYPADDGRTWTWRCWGDGDCPGTRRMEFGSEEYAHQRAAQHVNDRHQDGTR